MMHIDIFILLRQEIIPILLIFFLLVYKLGKERDAVILPAVMNVLLLINFLAGILFYDWQGLAFSGMYHTDGFVVMQKSILNLAFWLIAMQATGWLKGHAHAAEMYLLLLTTLLGMFLMLSSGHMLIFYIGLEMATIPLAAAVNFDLQKKRSSEAAMKLIISSAFSSALLLLGISFLYGITGTLLFAEIPQELHTTPVSILTFILIFSGFAFKISAVPFHLWTADVYEGAPIPVTAYLSVVSKAAVIFILGYMLYMVFRPLAVTWYTMMMILSLATIITGNLFALRQNNLKRFLAFSSIAQVGFVMVGLTGSSQHAMASVVYFILAYVFSNLAAFGVVTLVAQQTGRETITDYRELYRNNKTLSWILAIAVFSLAGVPPAVGFFGKFFLLMSGASQGDYLFISIAALNMVVSFYYYLKIVRAVFMEKNETPADTIPVPFWEGLSLWICVAGMLVTGFLGIVFSYIFSMTPSYQ